MVHLYLFGPKYGKSENDEERTKAYEEVRETINSEFGEKIENMKIREVRDIAVNNLQYCVTFKISHTEATDAKRIKIG